jgi:hypothetical protein
MLPRPSPPAKLSKMPISIVVLAFDHRVWFYRSPGYSNVPLTLNRGIKINAISWLTQTGTWAIDILFSDKHAIFLFLKNQFRYRSEKQN